MALAAELIPLLACPESGAPLLYFEEEGFLFCAESRLKFRIENDIPVLLVNEAERLDDAETQRLLELASQRGLTEG